MFTTNRATQAYATAPLGLACEIASQNIEIEEYSSHSLICRLRGDHNATLIGKNHKALFHVDRYQWHQSVDVERTGDGRLLVNLSSGCEDRSSERRLLARTSTIRSPIFAKIRNPLFAHQEHYCSVLNFTTSGFLLQCNSVFDVFVGIRTSLEVFAESKHGGGVAVDCRISDLRHSATGSLIHVAMKPTNARLLRELESHQAFHSQQLCDTPEEVRSISQDRVNFDASDHDGIYKVTAKIGDQHIFSASAATTGESMQWRMTEQNPRWNCLEVLRTLKTHVDANLDAVHSHSVDSFRSHDGRNHENKSLDEAINILQNEHDQTTGWTSYGIVYDKMCETNPHYKELLDNYADNLHLLRECGFQPMNAVDLGAGTGNFVEVFRSFFSDANIYHVDSDVTMNLVAREKYADSGLTNISFQVRTAEEFLENSQGNFDIITAIHSIYTMEDHDAVLKLIYENLKPGGIFYVVDIGREIDVPEWSRHLFYKTVNRLGFFRAIKYFWKAREVISQNRKIQSNQADGKYWAKSSDSFFITIKSHGFEILNSGTAYRNCSDYAICIKQTRSGVANHSEYNHSQNLHHESRRSHDD